MNNWQPIETAPDDSTEIWLGAPGRVIIGYRGFHKLWRSGWTSDPLTWQPTHWQPFEQPQPPSD